MIRSVDRGGLSLMELLVMLAVGLIVAKALTLLLGAGIRHWSSASHRSTGLMSSHLALSWIRHDLRQMDPRDVPVVADSGRRLEMGGLRYEHDARTGMLTRNGRPLGGAPFAEVRFGLASRSRGAGTTPRRGSVQGPLVWVRIVNQRSRRPVPGDLEMGLLACIRPEGPALRATHPAWVAAVRIQEEAADVARR